jgi:hypothetical protein
MDRETFFHGFNSSGNSLHLLTPEDLDAFPRNAVTSSKINELKG